MADRIVVDKCMWYSVFVACLIATLRYSVIIKCFGIVINVSNILKNLVMIGLFKRLFVDKMETG